MGIKLNLEFSNNILLSLQKLNKILIAFTLIHLFHLMYRYFKVKGLIKVKVAVLGVLENSTLNHYIFYCQEELRQ